MKALRSVVRLRKQDVDERKEQEAILETYLQALGDVELTPFCSSPRPVYATRLRRVQA